MSLPVWPKDEHEREQYYGHFLLHLSDFMHIDFDVFIAAHPDFPLQNPQQLLQAYLQGNIRSEDYRQAKNTWWDLIDARGIRSFALTDIHARFAIILLSVADKAQTDDDHMNQSLAWVYELMNMLSFQDKRFSYHKICSHMDGYLIKG